MGTKSKANKRHIHDNFKDLVVAATRANTRDYITQQVARASQIVAKDLADQLKPYDLLFDVFQDLLIELNMNIPGGNKDLTSDSIRQRVFDKEDGFLQLVPTDTAKVGDRVRFKLTDITKPESTQLLAIGKLGSTPSELNPELEAAIVGMRTGESKLVTLKLQDKEYNFEVVLARVSTPKVETKNETN